MQISQALIGTRRRGQRELYLLVPAVGVVVVVGAQVAGLPSNVTAALVSVFAVVLLAWLFVLAKLVLEVGVATRRVADIAEAHASVSAQLRSLVNSVGNDAEVVERQIQDLVAELGQLHGRFDELQALGKSHVASVATLDERLRALEGASLPELVDELALVVDELSTVVVGAAAS